MHQHDDASWNLRAIKINIFVRMKGVYSIAQYPESNALAKALMHLRKDTKTKIFYRRLLRMFRNYFDLYLND